MDVQQAAIFHAATKYYSLSETDAGDERIGIGDPTLRSEAIWQKDWDIKPLLNKVYETLPPIELVRDLPDAGRPALEAIAATGVEAAGVVPDRALLGRLGLLTNGSIDRTWTSQDGRVHHYRTAGGTGAQYHLELYFVCADLADLDAGVYHYCAIDHSLRRLRRGDFRAALIDATENEPSIAAAPVVLAMTSTFWRNAWRYRERAYRHTFWDAGTSLSHILAVAASAHVATGLVFGYADRLVDALLDVDSVRESTVALVALGDSAGRAPDAGVPPARPAHQAAVVGGGDLPRDHRPASRVRSADRRGGCAAAVRPVGSTGPAAGRRADRAAPVARRRARSAPPVEQIVLRRRSTRTYDTDAEIPFEAFSTLLERSTRGVMSDVLTPVHS